MKIVIVEFEHNGKKITRGFKVEKLNDNWFSITVNEIAFNINIFSTDNGSPVSNVYECTSKNADGSWNNNLSVLIDSHTYFLGYSIKPFNGLESWVETHYEVVQGISQIWFLKRPFGIVKRVQDAQGHGGLYELAQNLTNEFEALNIDRDWDGDFFDEIEKFLSEKLV